MIEYIHIEPIKLKWSDWYPWSQFLLDARTDPRALNMPDAPGVYEVKYEDDDKRLAIGKAANLRMRVKQGLVKGQVPHSTGKRIRSSGSTSRIVIRWATTDRPAAVEEELHRRHIGEFGELPDHTKRTRSELLAKLLRERLFGQCDVISFPLLRRHMLPIFSRAASEQCPSIPYDNQPPRDC